MTRPRASDRHAHLAALLDENIRAYAPEFSGGLTNHAPMALIARAWSGASDDEQSRFFETYRARLDARTADAGEDVAAFGARDAYALLRPTIEVCADESAAAAFHGLIRVRFAAAQGHLTELLHALAYWRHATSPLAELARTPPGGLSLDDAVRALVDARVIAPPARSIRARQASLVSDARFVGVARSLAAGERDDDFARLAETARALYVARDDFTSLHALTGAEAAWIVARYDHARARLYRATAHGVLACVANSDGPIRDERREDAFVRESAPPWDEIARAACAPDDDHVAKLFVACRSLDALAPHALWRALAHDRVARGQA